MGGIIGVKKNRTENSERDCLNGEATVYITISDRLHKQQFIVSADQTCQFKALNLIKFWFNDSAKTTENA